MNGNAVILLFIALLAMSLITRCGIRHTAGQVPEATVTTQADQSLHTEPTRPAATSNTLNQHEPVQQGGTP